MATKQKELKEEEEIKVIEGENLTKTDRSKTRCCD